MGTKPLVIVTRKLPELIETRMMELFDTKLSSNDIPLNSEELKEDFMVYEHKKFVFGHFKDTLGQTIYKFLGEFHMNFNKSGSTQTVWERVKTRIDLSGIELK